jgi:hypothetical protein
MSIRSHPVSRGVAALGLLALLAAGCSGGATPSSTATAAAPPANTTPSTGQVGTGTVDPCALATAAEAQAAMGLPVATTTKQDQGIADLCLYTSADANHWVAITLDHGSRDKAEFDLVNQRSDQEASVSGVGGDAYFNADTETLSVWQNGTDFSIQIVDHGDATPDQIQAAATKVALAVLTRL